MIHVETQACDSGFVVLLKGESSKEDVTNLAKKVLDSLPQSPNIIGLDFSRLVSMSSSLVIPLIQLRNHFNKPGEVLYLIDTPADFRFILQVAKIQHLFQFISSVSHLRQIMRSLQAFHPNEGKPQVIHDVLEK